MEIICSPKQAFLCKKEFCKICDKRRFANHRFASSYSTKNETDIKDIVLGNPKSFYLNCLECNKEWYLPIKKIVLINSFFTFCDDCNKRKIKENGTKCFLNRRELCNNSNCIICNSRRFMYHPTAKFYSINNFDSINDLTSNYNKDCIFECNICKHDSHAKIINITTNIYGTFCLYCSHDKLCGDNNCKFCFNNSFASHPKSVYWSSKNKISSNLVFKGTSDKYIFNCNVCTHEFLGRISHICNPNEETWCPFCHNEDLCKEPCEICYKRSFAQHPKSVYWSIDNKKDKPFQVYLNSTKYYLFDCPECFHQFSMQPGKINYGEHWCPYCSITALCEDENCSHCFERSFASSSHSSKWSLKNKKTPRMVFLKSSTNFLFDCDVCENEYKRMPADIYFHNSGCPVCVNKTEKMVFEYLKKNNFNEVQRAINFEWCKNLNTGRFLPFDIVLENKKIIIEIDGDQHFEYNCYMKNNLEQTQNRDLYKMKLAFENGYKVIRLMQIEVYQEKIKWRDMLKNYLENDFSENCVFIELTNKYNIYREKMINIHLITLDNELLENNPKIEELNEN